MKKFLERVNVFKQIKELQKFTVDIACAHNVVEARQRVMLDGLGYIIVTNKKGKTFLRKKRVANKIKQSSDAPRVKRKYTKRKVVN